MIVRRTLFRALLTGCASLFAGPRASVGDDVPPSSKNDENKHRGVWRSAYEGTRVWGYVDKHSVVAGEAFNIMLSTGPDYKTIKGNVEISRIGYYRNEDRHLFSSI